MTENDLKAPSDSVAIHTDNQLTDWDRELLRRYLRFYQSLDSGDRKPATHLQLNFVSVCRGNAQPRTQHEIAYSRFRIARHQPSGPTSRGTDVAIADAASGLPVSAGFDFRTRLDAINRIEALLDLVPSRSKLVSIVGGLQTRLRSAVGRTTESIASSVPLATAILSDPELARAVEQWSADTFNTLSNVYTKAMDGSFVEGLRTGADYVAPTVHRLFGGHTPTEAWDAVRSALPNDSFTQELVGYLAAMGSDFASVTGLPLTTLDTPEALTKFVEFFQGLGLSESWVVDVLHQNAVEFIGAAVPAIGVALCFNKIENEQFGRIVGSLGVATIVAANPLGALAVLVMLGLAYKRTVGLEDGHSLATAIGTGAATGGTVIAISSIVGGPAVVGITVAVLASIAVRKLGPRLDRDRVFLAATEAMQRAWKSWAKFKPTAVSTA